MFFKTSVDVAFLFQILAVCVGSIQWVIELKKQIVLPFTLP